LSSCAADGERPSVLLAVAAAQTDGGYLGADFETFFSAVTSGAAGVYVGTLMEDAGISTDLTITPGQTVSVSGDPSLPQAPSWGGGGFTVQERGSLALAGISLGASVSFTVVGGGSLSLASMAVPAAMLGRAQYQLSGAGSTLRLAAVTVPEAPDAGELTGTMTVGADGSKVIDSVTPWPGFFAVISGPCAVSEGGRCVGRPGGYLPSEACEIAVGGGGGVLGACGVFDTYYNGNDYVTLPDGRNSGSIHYGSDCPAGAVLAAGGSVGWISDGSDQGSVRNGNANGCGAKGLCGLPHSGYGLGGGWQICFAA
jgi:hypothetical protein